MELFRYRNVALGCSFFLLFLIISYYLYTPIKIATLALAGVAFALIISFYCLKKSPFALKLLIRATLPCLFIILAMVISLISFGKSPLLQYCDDNAHTVYATVTDVNYKSSYISSYVINVHRVDENEVDEDVSLSIYGTELERGDVIEAQCVFEEINSEPLGFDERGYNLSKGISFKLAAQSYNITGHEKTVLKDILEAANKYLDGRLSTIEDEDTYAMLSALFLGNKSLLKGSVKRDFARLGLSHILALSGMHITIVVTLLGFALEKIGLRKILRELILILSTLFFVGMTGFSESALRAGLMLSLVYLLSFFGNRLDIITSLFVSVTLICIFDPFSIFSVSLILSFFAMLGCAISVKFAHRVQFFKKMKNTFLRYIILNLMTSVFAMMFTLVVVYLVFGNVAVLSPISNLLLSPVFTVLIYLCPAYIIFSYIPYISVAFGWILKTIVSFITFIGENCASIDHALVPIINYVQIIGILVISLFLLGFLVVRRRYTIFALIGVMCGIIVFALGTGILYSERNNNIYVGAVNNGSCEVVFVEEKNNLSLFDINADGNLPYYVSQHLGYYEIERYIVTDYTRRTYTTVNELCNNLIVKRIYMPNPLDEGEIAELERIKELAQEKDIPIEILGNSIETECTSISLNLKHLKRSTKRTVAIKVTGNGATFTYLGAGTYELENYFAEDAAYASDVIAFGAYGPTFKVNFGYRVPYLDYCVFLGDSVSYADEGFLDSIGEKALPSKDYPYRFKLTP
ncbi:MAG: ComEC family competence protein [Ruminococcaceae bacterium]|nr:ComEC family competence protein [Oscillospiraceae bacterium]